MHVEEVTTHIENLARTKCVYRPKPAHSGDEAR
jgi:hypothetical protein